MIKNVKCVPKLYQSLLSKNVIFPVCPALLSKLYYKKYRQNYSSIINHQSSIIIYFVGKENERSFIIFRSFIKYHNKIYIKLIKNIYKFKWNTIFYL